MEKKGNVGFLWLLNNKNNDSFLSGRARRKTTVKSTRLKARAWNPREGKWTGPAAVPRAGKCCLRVRLYIAVASRTMSNTRDLPYRPDQSECFVRERHRVDHNLPEIKDIMIIILAKFLLISSCSNHIVLLVGAE